MIFQCCDHGVNVFNLLLDVPFRLLNFAVVHLLGVEVVGIERHFVYYG